jgi:hypothetical protein
MFRRLIAAVFLSLVVYCLSGCAGSAKTVIDRESIPYFAETKILSVTLMNGDVLAFDSDGGRYYERYRNKNRVIAGRTEVGKMAEIPLDNVRRARLENHEVEISQNGFVPVVLIVGVLAVIL